MARTMREQSKQKSEKLRTICGSYFSNLLRICAMISRLIMSRSKKCDRRKEDMSFREPTQMFRWLDGYDGGSMKDFYRIKPQSMFRCSDGYDGSMKDWEQLQNKTTIEA